MTMSTTLGPQGRGDCAEPAIRDKSRRIVRELQREGRAGFPPTRPAYCGDVFRLQYATQRSRTGRLTQRPAGGELGRGAIPVVGEPPGAPVVRAGGL